MLNHNVAWSGGTFFRAYHFARQMTTRGHEVTLLTTSPTRRFGFRRERPDGVDLVETPDWFWGRIRTGWDPWDTLQRIRYVRGGAWDLMHAFDSRPAVILPALILRRRGVPLVLDWADWWGRGGTITERSTGALVRLLGPVETFFEEAFRSRADGTTVISTALRARAIALGVRPDSIALIPQGSDVDGIKPRAKDVCRRDLGLAAATPLVGYLGVLTRSDARLLFDAFASLRKRRPDCQLVLVGNHRAQLPFTTGILETGFVRQEHLVQYLGACDIMLLPLKDTVASRGRWPSKINDYLAAGRPVVATAVGDIRELFERHQIGHAVADEPEAFANAVDGLLEDAELRTVMGRNARGVAERLLAWPILGEQLERHYQTVLRSAGHIVGAVSCAGGG